MPNGGSDNCGTCWFNRKNHGARDGMRHTDNREPPHCEIRNEPIEKPFYTYCANHPHRRSGRDPIPIGPILVGQKIGGFAYKRVIWKLSPDTEDIRQHLLDLLAETEETAVADSYPAYPSVMQTVVWQLGEFRERRAEETLQRLADELPGEPANLVQAALKRIREGAA